MRTVSAANLLLAQADDGVETTAFVEIDTGAGLLTFSDKDFDGTDARIMELGSLNMQVAEGGVSSAGSVSVKLSDEDHYLRDLLCSTRFEGRTARILIRFNDGDPIELLVGRVGSPVVWQEESRTFEFDVVSYYEAGSDTEVPYTPDEDSELQEFAKHKPWPRIYGTPVDVPAVLVVDAPRGSLTRELQPLYESFEMEEADNVEFPLGETITVEVGNEWMTGQFTLVRDDPTTILRFDIQERNVSKGIIFSKDRAGLDAIEGAPEGFESWQADPRYALWDTEGRLLAGNWLLLLDSAETMDSGVITSINMPTGTLFGQVSLPSFVGNKNYILYQKGEATRGQFPWIVPSGLYYITIGAKADIRGVLDVNDTLWPAGTPVRQVLPIKYVVSDIPALRVLQVRAWREVKLDERGGSRQELVVLPPDFYTVVLNDTVDGRSCTTIELQQSLSSRGAGWEDQIYVTVKSAYGPNVSDIVEHLMEEAGITVDGDSFDLVSTQCEKYPMHFAILNQQDALQLAGEIAFQGRCGLSVPGSIAFLKYLSLEGDIVFGYDEMQNVIEGLTQLTSTETTNVSNDLTVTWRKRGTQDEPEKLRYRNDESIDAFGRKKKELDIFVYRHKRLVQKSAQFWHNRWSRVWRKVRVVSDNDPIAVVVYDDVNLPLEELNTHAVVEQLEHDTENDQIAAMLWTPVEVGSCDPSAYAYLDDDADVAPPVLDLDDAEDLAEVIEVGPVDTSLSEPETHVGEALDAQVDAGPIGGVFNAKLYKSNNASGDVVEESVTVQNLSETAVEAGDILSVHKSEDGTYYAVKASAASLVFYGAVTAVGTGSFTATIYRPTATTSEQVATGASVTLIGSDPVAVGDLVTVYKTSDGIYWSRGNQSANVAMARVTANSGDKTAVPIRLYRTANITGGGDEDAIAVNPDLADGATIAADTWVIAVRLNGTWMIQVPVFQVYIA